MSKGIDNASFRFKPDHSGWAIATKAPAFRALVAISGPDSSSVGEVKSLGIPTDKICHSSPLLFLPA